MIKHGLDRPRGAVGARMPRRGEMVQDVRGSYTNPLDWTDEGRKTGECSVLQMKLTHVRPVW